MSSQVLVYHHCTVFITSLTWEVTEVSCQGRPSLPWPGWGPPSWPGACTPSAARSSERTKTQTHSQSEMRTSYISHPKKELEAWRVLIDLKSISNIFQKLPEELFCSRIPLSWGYKVFYSGKCKVPHNLINSGHLEGIAGQKLFHEGGLNNFITDLNILFIL